MSLGDLIFHLGQWLRTTPMNELALDIQKTPASKAADGFFWFVPIFQTIHILAIAALFGSVVMMSLRIFQLAGRSRTMTQTVNRFLPWVWWSLLTLLLTGIGLTISDPVRELTNPCFWMKMILIIFAALVALGFQSSVRRNAARWEVSADGRLAIRAGAVSVVALWCLIMVLGRWIAYAPT
jgi:uncharacterized membrane protein SirB2